MENNFDYKEYNEKKYKTKYWTITRSKYKWFSNYVKLRVFKEWAEDVQNKDAFLDLGGGVGNWAFHFLNKYKKVIVLDISEEALRHIPEKEIIKVAGSATKIPLKNESVDCILLADVFEHILPKDLNKMMSELYRVLRKNGLIIIYTTQYGYGIDLIRKRLFGLMDGRLKLSEKNSGHLNRLKFSEFKRLIRKHNLYLEDYYHYSIIFKQLVEFTKNSIAKIIGKFTKDKSVREGQKIKDKMKSIKEPNIAFRIIFGTISFMLYFDILLFGKLIQGSSIFLKIRKSSGFGLSDAQDVSLDIRKIK